MAVAYISHIDLYILGTIFQLTILFHFICNFILVGRDFKLQQMIKSSLTLLFRYPSNCATLITIEVLCWGKRIANVYHHHYDFILDNHWLPRMTKFSILPLSSPSSSSSLFFTFLVYYKTSFRILLSYVRFICSFLIMIILDTSKFCCVLFGVSLISGRIDLVFYS
jgi:hypothetical protein